MEKRSHIMLAVIMLATVLVAVSACGIRTEEDCIGEECSSEIPDDSSSDDGDDSEEIADLNKISVYTSSDEFMGYALDYHFDYIKMYIPADDRYVTVHPTTGEYLRLPVVAAEEIYFDGLDCSGNAVMINWSGSVGNTYIKAKDEKTYLIQGTAQYNINNRFSAVSRLVANRPDGDSCRNSNYTVETYAANLIETAALDELTGFAPLQMFAQGE